MSKKILVVDDDADVAKLLKSKLDALARYEVMTATGGKIAWALVQSGQPDLVLCDIDMPDMDGPAVSAAMSEKEATRNIPVIFLSSLISAQEQSKQTSGRWPVISKESPFSDLVKRIDEMLEGTAAGA
jgi:CheY-like chemotaxis protein